MQSLYLNIPCCCCCCCCCCRCCCCCYCCMKQTVVRCCSSLLQSARLAIIQLFLYFLGPHLGERSLDSCRPHPYTCPSPFCPPSTCLVEMSAHSALRSKLEKVHLHDFPGFPGCTRPGTGRSGMDAREQLNSISGTSIPESINEEGSSQNDIKGMRG